MTGPVALTDLRIWDGDKQLDADTIRMEGPRIVALGGKEELAADARAISFAGAWAVPGLIDAHVHMVLDPERRTPPGPDEKPEYAAMRARALTMVRAGITTARDLGGGHHLELALRDDIAAGRIPGPRLLCAGQPVTAQGGHCHFWGGEADGIEAMLTVADKQLNAGADLLKVMATGGVMTGGSRPLTPQFTSTELEALASFAAERGVALAAHCHGTAGIDAAARAGVDTLEHCSWVGAEGWASDYRLDVAELIARRGIRVSPTINAGWQRMIGNASGERVSAALSSMIALGIPLVASTDAGIPGVQHDGLPLALDVFRRLSRQSHEFVLRTATSGAADGLGLGDVTGRLRAGLAADVLVLDGNPLRDFDALRRPVGVWAQGRALRLP